MIPGAEHVQRAFRVPVLVAALLVVPVLILEEVDLGSPGDGLVDAANWALWGVFLAELLAVFVAADRKRDVLRRQPLMILMVVLTPPVMPASLQAVRTLRLLALVRLLIALRVSTALARRVFSVQSVAYGAVLVLVVALAGGAALAAVEPGLSTWNGVWLSVETMTTVGYGDIVPKTTAGRVMAIGIMVVGIGFVSVVTGAFAQRFMAEEARKARAGRWSRPARPEQAEASGAPDAAAPPPAGALDDAAVLASVRDLRRRLDELERLMTRRLG